jgi:hypothetical protein
MADEMFFSPDSRSLRRGKRVARRTVTCRPCILWPVDLPEIRMQGVVLDINPYGMLVRMLEPVPVGTRLQIQLMRDDQFQEPLSVPVEGKVVRHAAAEGVFTDHGIRVEQKEVRRQASQGARHASRLAGTPHSRARMHTIDITIGDSGIRRR